MLQVSWPMAIPSRWTGASTRPPRSPRRPPRGECNTHAPGRSRSWPRRCPTARCLGDHSAWRRRPSSCRGPSCLRSARYPRTCRETESTYRSTRHRHKAGPCRSPPTPPTSPPSSRPRPGGPWYTARRPSDTSLTGAEPRSAPPPIADPLALRQVLDGQPDAAAGPFRPSGPGPLGRDGAARPAALAEIALGIVVDHEDVGLAGVLIEQPAPIADVAGLDEGAARPERRAVARACPPPYPARQEGLNRLRQAGAGIGIAHAQHRDTGARPGQIRADDPRPGRHAHHGHALADFQVARIARHKRGFPVASRNLQIAAAVQPGQLPRLEPRPLRVVTHLLISSLSRCATRSQRVRGALHRFVKIDTHHPRIEDAD